jgi:hypothetical protein
MEASRMSTDDNQVGSSVDDMARLIQEVLVELGSAADPIEVARRVRGLDGGLPAEDEFAVVCSWLGHCRIAHKLDQQQTPVSSRDSYQVPDLLVALNAAGPFLIEIKVKQDQTLSFRSDYLRRLMAYAELLGLPLLIAWKFHSMWSLFDARHLRLAQAQARVSAPRGPLRRAFCLSHRRSLRGAGELLAKRSGHSRAIGLVGEPRIVFQELLEGAHDLASFEIGRSA